MCIITKSRIMAKLHVHGTNFGHLICCSLVRYNEKWQAVSTILLGNSVLIEETEGKTKFHGDVVTDNKRCEVLEKHFGIILTPEELKRGMRTYPPKL
jgi:hypothetical protein